MKTVVVCSLKYCTVKLPRMKQVLYRVTKVLGDTDYVVIKMRVVSSI